MPQKKVKKTPVFLIFFFITILALLSLIFWTVFGNCANSVASAAGLSLSDIEYASIRVKNDNGQYIIKKISSKDDISKLYSSLLNTPVHKRICFGSQAQIPNSGISIKIKGKNGIFKISDSSNIFKLQNSGILSPFFTCYYDISDAKAFNCLIKSFAA